MLENHTKWEKKWAIIGLMGEDTGRGNEKSGASKKGQKRTRGPQNRAPKRSMSITGWKYTRGLGRGLALKAQRTDPMLWMWDNRLTSGTREGHWYFTAVVEGGTVFG